MIIPPSRDVLNGGVLRVLQGLKASHECIKSSMPNPLLPLVDLETTSNSSKNFMLKIENFLVWQKSEKSTKVAI